MFRDRNLTRVELARLEGTVATLVAAVASGHSDHEGRLRRLEQWRYSVPLTVIAALAAAIATFLSH